MTAAPPRPTQRRVGRIVIIGGGIAGLATARALARRGREVLLVEAERQLGTQSTGRNAAIFRLAVAEPVNVRLALRSRDIGNELVPGGVVRALGGLYPCDDAHERAAILDAAASAGVRASTPADVPDLLTHRQRPGVFSPYDGVIDVHALVQALATDARAAGATLQLGTPVDALDLEAGRVRGVQLAGDRIAAELVIDATGAWSPDLPGAPLAGVRPHRRHLFVIDTPDAARLDRVVWDLTDGVYMRPESGGLLVCPCDETPMHGSTSIPVDPEIPAELFAKLSDWAPDLARARVRRVWAGLRPLTADHRFVVGPDPRLPGLFRVGGFGGHGMTAGPAAGELAAALICGDVVPEARELDPARFC